MNSLDFIIAGVACGLVFLSMVVGYSIGHKDGHREGYSKGRSISRVKVN